MNMNLVPGLVYYRSTWRDFFSCDASDFDDAKIQDITWRVKVLEDFLFPNLSWKWDEYSINLIYDTPSTGLMQFGRAQKNTIRDRQLLLCDVLHHFGFYKKPWYGAMTTLHDLKDLRLMLSFIAPFYGLVGIGINHERVLHAKTNNSDSYPYLTWPDFNYDIPYLNRRDRAVDENRLHFI